MLSLKVHFPVELPKEPETENISTEDSEAAIEIGSKGRGSNLKIQRGGSIVMEISWGFHEI